MWGVRDKGNGREGTALSMDDDKEANKPLPQAGTDANGGGHQQSDDRLALARRELAASNANAHGGRTMSLNDVTNEGGGGAGVSTYNNPQKSGSKSGSDNGSNSGSNSGSDSSSDSSGNDGRGK